MLILVTFSHRLQQLWCFLNALDELVKFAMLENICSSLLFYVFIYFFIVRFSELGVLQG